MTNLKIIDPEMNLLPLMVKKEAGLTFLLTDHGR
jgi:hypothetical protein